MARAVIATLGPDRPGLVNELSELVHGLALNIDDSRMTVLGGEFAVLMSVAGETGALDALEQQLAELAERSGQMHLFRRTADREPSSALPCRVTVVAMDHPGIVRSVAGFFSGRGINIRDLETATEPAPHTGTPIFNLEMVIDLPAGQKLSTLRQAFVAFCDDEDLDGSLSAL